METEKQVAEHLDSHLEKLPPNDHQSRAIIKTMHTDECHHGTAAMLAGGRELPTPIPTLMALTSKIMTNTAYYY